MIEGLSYDVFRPTELDDHETLLDFIERNMDYVYGDNSYEIRRVSYTERIRKCNLMICGFVDGEIVGCAGLEPSVSDGFWDILGKHPCEEIVLGVVDARFRRQGLLRKLTGELMTAGVEYVMAMKDDAIAGAAKDPTYLGCHLNKDGWNLHAYTVTL